MRATVRLGVLMSTAVDRILASDPMGEVLVPRVIIEKYPKAFGLRVDGGGMSRVIPDGADIIVDPCDEAADGDIVAVELDGGGIYMRRWHMGSDTLMLTADGYEERSDMVFRGDELASVSLIGRVVWYQKCGEVE